jgi:rhodanese-related sulfurtransferase
MSNAILIVAMVLLLFISYRFFAVKSTPKGYANLSAKEFEAKMQEPNTILLDVRTQEEVSEGFIKGTTHFIDYMGENFEQEIETLDPNKHYLVYCRSGNRSAKACEFLAENGFTQISNLAGGFWFWQGEVNKI